MTFLTSQYRYFEKTYLGESIALFHVEPGPMPRNPLPLIPESQNEKLDAPEI